jgi:hypothetical protein
VSGTSSSTSEPAGFVYDTGEPGAEVHTGYGLLSSTLSSFVGSDGFLSDGTTMSLNTSGITSFASGWDYASVASSGNQILVADSSNIAGYVNTGLESYFGESVMFDLADGVIGFKAIACFADGTANETPQGPVAVDNLAIGDMVTTITGEMREVRWIGYRNVDCWHHPRPETVLPVRIQADAFGPDLPRRDLYLSPDHALDQEDVLIPVKYLINGGTVAQIGRPRVTYYHLEFKTHDVILAEGLPAETYLETGQHNLRRWRHYRRLPPDPRTGRRRRSAAMGCWLRTPSSDGAGGGTCKEPARPARSQPEAPRAAAAQAEAHRKPSSVPRIVSRCKRSSLGVG